MERPGITEREAYKANNAEAFRILQELVARYIDEPSNASAIPVLVHTQRMIGGTPEPGRKEALEKALRPFREIRSQQNNRP